MAQELLNTFGQELSEVALIPGTGGVFRIEVDGEMIWDRKQRGGFPEITVLKQLVPRQKTLVGQFVACVTVSFGTVQVYWS